jgi:hypothetical protein
MEIILGFFASFDKAQMPSFLWQTSAMGKDAASILADNLDRLMNSQQPRPSQAAIAKSAHLDQKTVSRILNRSVATSVTAVESLAKIWGLQAWQLLFPDLDPSNPPVAPVTEAEKRFYEQIKKAAMSFAAEPRPPYEK